LVRVRGPEYGDTHGLGWWVDGFSSLVFYPVVHGVADFSCDGQLLAVPKPSQATWWLTP